MGRRASYATDMVLRSQSCDLALLFLPKKEASKNEDIDGGIGGGVCLAGTSASYTTSSGKWSRVETEKVKHPRTRGEISKPNDGLKGDATVEEEMERNRDVRDWWRGVRTVSGTEAECGTKLRQTGPVSKTGTDRSWEA
jgi:hypothetical protein